MQTLSHLLNIKCGFEECTFLEKIKIPFKTKKSDAHYKLKIELSNRLHDYKSRSFILLTSVNVQILNLKSFLFNVYKHIIF